jgi:hypothetical protein
MIKKLLLILTLAPTACAPQAVPVKITFPSVPDSLLEPAPDLIPMSKDNHNQLSNMIQNANSNYSRYRELSVKYNAWQEWYRQQKIIFDGVK